VSSKDRIKRPKLERTRAIRSWSSQGNGDTGERSGPLPRTGSTNDVVSRSVEVGYRVIDEYIRQGQTIARRFNDRTWAPAAMTNDMQELTSRMAQYTAELTTLWAEAMQTLAGGPGRWPTAPHDGVAQSVPPASAKGEPPTTSKVESPPSPSQTPELTRVRVAVTSPYPTEVSVDLRPYPAGRRILVQSLRDADPGKPRLSDVSIDDPGGGEPVTFRVRVPEGQPAGVYNALIIDEESNRPFGTVSLRITPE
jgi:hypothetical protein